MIPNAPEDDGKETYKVSGHLIRGRPGSFERATSPLVTRASVADKVCVCVCVCVCVSGYPNLL